MTVFMVPELDESWPSLGPRICQWIEANLVFGPGDLRGQPAKVDLEKQALIYRMYEVFPQGAKDLNGKLIEGRRRFRQCSVSLQKGSAKTELAAWIAACELHPTAPVRCIGFDSKGRPLGTGVADPYIALVAYTEEQSEDLAYAALKSILELSPIRQDFDIGLERIMRAGGDGKAVALAGSPDARDGARTTFQHFDETHRWTLPRLKRAAVTMNANLPKRLLADPWGLQTTTAYVPGEGSVAQDTREYADQVASGGIKDSHLFYFHRQAREGFDLRDPQQLREAIKDAAGPTAAWKDIDGIASQWQDPKADFDYLERVYLNRPISTAAQAFSADCWRAGSRGGKPPAPGELITLGFDGSLVEDSTALIGTGVVTGFQWPLGIWERPYRAENWEVPKAEVSAVVDETFRTWDVWRMYADPTYWETQLAEWAGRWGSGHVVEWPTRLTRKMAIALKAYATAIKAGEVTHNGDPAFARHIGAAQKMQLSFRDEDDTPLWLIQKDRPDSPNKIDAAMAGTLSWQARLDALASGAKAGPKAISVYIPGDDDG